MDVYQIVTDRIIAEMEQGVIPWHQPWCDVREGAYNRISGRPYSLLNQLVLGQPGEYATLRQWNRLGGHIRKGERSRIIVFWKWPEKVTDQQNNPKDDADQDCVTESEQTETKRQRPVLKYYHVFHVNQVDNVEPLPKCSVTYDTKPIDRAEALFHQYLEISGVNLEEETSSQAYYSPAKDLIHLPTITQFENSEEYYSTAYHEMIHSTGHTNRLNRSGVHSICFGSEEYSKEELIAEIGAATLLHEVGIDTEGSIKNSAAYIKSWLSVLKNDKRFIVSVASQAEKAIQYVMNNKKMQ